MQGRKNFHSKYFMNMWIVELMKSTWEFSLLRRIYY